VGDTSNIELCGHAELHVRTQVEQMGRQADQYPGIQSKQYVQNPAVEHRWKRWNIISMKNDWNRISPRGRIRCNRRSVTPCAESDTKRAPSQDDVT
jgi:hypothetical protein